MNMSIRCQITECKFNESNEHYCTLNKIEVIKNKGQTSSTMECTECGSFIAK